MPVTAQRYDCGRCKEWEHLDHAPAPATMHIGLVFDGLLADGKRGMNKLHGMVGGRSACTHKECADYFWAMHGMGATHHPIGDNCERFCYRRGCMGHTAPAKEGGAE